MRFAFLASKMLSHSFDPILLLDGLIISGSKILTLIATLGSKFTLASLLITRDQLEGSDKGTSSQRHKVHIFLILTPGLV